VLMAARAFKRGDRGHKGSLRESDRNGRSATHLRASIDRDLSIAYSVVEWFLYRVELSMSLNIKNEETARLIHELANLTGESLTGAVRNAVQERIARLHRERKGSLAQHLLSIGRETAPLFKEPYRSIEHGDLLYDELGLPK